MQDVFWTFKWLLRLKQLKEQHYSKFWSLCTSSLNKNWPISRDCVPIQEWERSFKLSENIPPGFILSWFNKRMPHSPISQFLFIQRRTRFTHSLFQEVPRLLPTIAIWKKKRRKFHEWGHGLPKAKTARWRPLGTFLSLWGWAEYW